MTQAAINYGRVLCELAVPKEAVAEAAGLLKDTPELGRALRSPVVTKAEKHRVIDRIFPESMRNFLKVLSDRQDMALAGEIFEAYHVYACEKEGILLADLFCVTEPKEEQLQKIRHMLCEKYRKNGAQICIKRDPKLIGGFILRVGDIESDFSMRGRMKQLEQKLIRR